MFEEGRKAYLARVLYRSHFLDLYKPIFGSRLVVYGYHRIRSDDAHDDLRFDEAVYGPTASQFEAHVKWLAKNTRILSEDELIECLSGERFPARTNVLLTFDDGYRDNYTYAFPVLKKLGLPATFFISTNIINTRQLAWWDIIAYLLKETNKQVVDYKGESIPVADSPKVAISLMLDKMKLVESEKTQDLVQELSRACDVPLPEIEIQDRQLMTWDQVREVSDSVIAIGSHTHTHRVLGTLNAEEQRVEMTVSKSILEEKIKKPVKSIAYPVGGYAHLTVDSMRIAKEAGYDLGFSFMTGFNLCRGINPHNVKRIDGPADISMLAATTKFPEIFVGSCTPPV